MLKCIISLIMIISIRTHARIKNSKNQIFSAALSSKKHTPRILKTILKLSDDVLGHKWDNYPHKHRNALYDAKKYLKSNVTV